jgi:hypothetical protein
MFVRGNPFKKAPLMFGPSGSLKTTYFNVLGECLGTKSCHDVSFQDVCEFGKNSQYAQVEYKNALVIHSGEIGIDITRQHTETFKDLNGLKPTITVRDIYGKRETVNDTHKHWVETNIFPRFEDVDPADCVIFMHRFHVVETYHVWTETEITDFLENDRPKIMEEMPFVMTMLLDRLPALIKRGRLVETSDIVEKWEANIDPFVAFLSANFDTDKEDAIARDERDVNCWISYPSFKLLVDEWNADKKHKTVKEPTKSMRNHATVKKERLGDKSKRGPGRLPVDTFVRVKAVCPKCRQHVVYRDWIKVGGKLTPLVPNSETAHKCPPEKDEDDEPEPEVQEEQENFDADDVQFGPAATPKSTREDFGQERGIIMNLLHAQAGQHVGYDKIEAAIGKDPEETSKIVIAMKNEVGFHYNHYGAWVDE